LSSRCAREIRSDLRHTFSQIWDSENDWHYEESWNDCLKREEGLKDFLKPILDLEEGESSSSNNKSGEEYGACSWDVAVERYQLFDMPPSKLNDQLNSMKAFSAEISNRRLEILEKKSALVGKCLGLLRDSEQISEREGKRSNEEAPSMFIATVVGAILGWVVGT
jgi:hypothetical protein